MANRGRKPKPSYLHLVEGNPGHHPVKKPQVKPAPIMPACPRWLNNVAKTEWKRIGPVLFDLGLLAREDMAAFASYCENYAILVQCGNYIKRKGGYAKYLAGKNSQTAPHLAAMNKAMEKIKAFCSEFGMTPNSRGRIEIPVGPDDEGDEDLD